MKKLVEERTTGLVASGLISGPDTGPAVVKIPKPSKKKTKMDPANVGRVQDDGADADADGESFAYSKKPASDDAADSAFLDA